MYDKLFKYVILYECRIWTLMKVDELIAKTKSSIAKFYTELLPEFLDDLLRVDYQ